MTAVNDNIVEIKTSQIKNKYLLPTKHASKWFYVFNVITIELLKWKNRFGIMVV